MNIGLRNFKTLHNALYTIKLSQQQCSFSSLASVFTKQPDGYTTTTTAINNGPYRWWVNNIVDAATTVNATTSISTTTRNGLWGGGKFYQIRRYSNISPKSEEREEKKLKQSGNDENDNKEMPETEKRTMPRLMNFPEIMWPSMLNSIKNWIMVQFIIRPYMDREFNLRDFAIGAKTAMQVISSKLMNGDFVHLGNLVTSDAIDEMKPVIQKLSVSQRRQLEVKESDIYLTFPYQVGIMFDEENEEAQKRWVEITMVFHVLRGFKEMRESGEEVPWNMGLLPEYQDRVFVCNYRFIKEFTKGKESDWTVNIVNHFKPIDLVNELKRP